MVIGGEVTTKANFDAEEIASRVYKKIGYKDKLRIITNIVKQSPDIAQGVDTGGAGDQGIMYGYATNETKKYLPLGVVLVHKLTKGLERLRKSGEIKWLEPDGKAQVTIINGKVATVLVSTQHSDKVGIREIKKTLKEKLIKPLGLNNSIKILINPTGKFVLGGFAADTGLTGRKIMVDTYGGLIPHGGGCFSGKDPTKVDRSAAYMARYAAKSIVKKGLADKCLVSVSYAIGKAEPLMVEAFDGNGNNLNEYVQKSFDFRPLSIIKKLGLRKPIYEKTASYGHFGKSFLPWEKTT
jgi:S-adenosylmethionine synthetase